ncbi:MAG: DUF4760 domain-containing protein [Nitrososphaerales archaeon]
MPAKRSKKAKRMTTTDKPTFEDAQVLLKLNDWQMSERIFPGWTFSQFDFDVKSVEEFNLKYPRGTKQSDYFYSIGHFFEVAGVLVRYGLLKEDLFFDTFWFEPIWKNFEPVIKSMRKEYNEPSIEENFEFLYNRYLAWKKERSAKK